MTLYMIPKNDFVYKMTILGIISTCSKCDFLSHPRMSSVSRGLFWVYINPIGFSMSLFQVSFSFVVSGRFSQNGIFPYSSAFAVSAGLFLIYTYWVATISRLLKIIGLFCRISSLL